ncbi:alpha/beta fold hydrolase [Nocardia sp. CY41]|uniref:alpha/beta fold hydrolase n=1 Tax=Nocardia sp. CY41 TaxID=2608686 RepID=UPI002E27CD1D|nr:alpha/beta fold hydrolase [Nocardia sp. CY41]
MPSTRAVSQSLTWRRGTAFGAFTLLASLAGMVAMFLSATVTDRPVLFLGTGWTTFAFGILASGRIIPRSSRRRITALTITTLTIFGGAALLLPGPRPETELPNGYNIVTLPTGAKLAVLKLAARHSTRTPIMILHGGPGVPDLAANRRVFEPLTQYGADIYLYAQVGTGASSRLGDPQGYSRGRDVADLEALRQSLGLHRMILIGHSYGGAVAAQYLVENSDKVAALILMSPMPLDPRDRSGDRVIDRLDIAQRLRLYRSVAFPRALTAYALLQVNPRAAHAYFSDEEADFRNDIVLQRAAPALHCSEPHTNEPVEGTGFYAAQYPQSATAMEPADMRGNLAGILTPTLIIKASCDYLSWSSAVDYKNRLVNSKLLYLSGAGHNMHQDKPEIVLDTIIAFLDQKPILDHADSAAPPDYEGPP